VDTSRTFGSAQLGTLIAGEIDAGLQVTGLAMSGSTPLATTYYGDQPTSAQCSGKRFSQTTGSAGEVSYDGLGYNTYMAMTRPRNVALLACIRYQ
jgi:hypothetical protein